LHGCRGLEHVAQCRGCIESQGLFIQGLIEAREIAR
jgi:hypothetical protein